MICTVKISNYPDFSADYRKWHFCNRHFYARVIVIRWQITMLFEVDGNL